LFTFMPEAHMGLREIADFILAHPARGRREFALPGSYFVHPAATPAMQLEGNAT
jgi:hypothetical protein